MSCRSFLLVKLEAENSAELDTSLSYLTSNILVSLQSIFGEVGKQLSPLALFSVLSSRSSDTVFCPQL